MKQLKLSLFVLLIAYSFSSAQTPDKIVDIKVIPKTKVIKAGSAAEIEVVLNIKEGWHINSNKPLGPNLIPTILKLEDTSSFKVMKIEYPQPFITTLSFSENELALYEMETVIKLQVKINKGYKKDKLLVSGKVQYQPCNDQTCLFPYTKKFSGELKITK